MGDAYDEAVATRAQYENVESDEEMESANVVFNLSEMRFKELGEMADPLAGSMLDVENGHTARVPITSQVQMAAARAKDALEAFSDLTVTAGVLRPFAHYSLIRQASEGAALAQWLLRPGVKYKRVHRSLNLEFSHDEDAREFARTYTREPRNAASPELNRTLRRLNELKDTVSQLREMELKHIPSWTDILIDISPPLGRTTGGHAPDSPLVVWKIASAFLHGSSTTVRMLSDLQQLTEFDERRIASMQITPSWRVLAASYGTCVQMLYDLHERYDYLATHDYGKRLVEAEPHEHPRSSRAG